jgi:hypothetical protein
MFSPCPGFPVPLLGAWRSNAEQAKRMEAEVAQLLDYQMNWLGWQGAAAPPPSDAPQPEDAN